MHDNNEGRWWKLSMHYQPAVFDEHGEGNAGIYVYNMMVGISKLNMTLCWIDLTSPLCD